MDSWLRGQALKGLRGVVGEHLHSHRPEPFHWKVSLHRLRPFPRCSVTGAQDLLGGAFELLGQALLAHLADNVQEDVLREVTSVLDVLGLPRALLQGDARRT